MILWEIQTMERQEKKVGFTYSIIETGNKFDGSRYDEQDRKAVKWDMRITKRNVFLIFLIGFLIFVSMLKLQSGFLINFD